MYCESNNSDNCCVHVRCFFESPPRVELDELVPGHGGGMRRSGGWQGGKVQPRLM